mmetsp:Transcript_38846/g.120061  ORF Transcript_38846/g.120061 Transcript_38846/m.120061 type:complete len:624 (-) Transcript_38846:1189-3060(-)
MLGFEKIEPDHATAPLDRVSHAGASGSWHRSVVAVAKRCRHRWAAASRGSRYSFVFTIGEVVQVRMAARRRGVPASEPLRRVHEVFGFDAPDASFAHRLPHFLRGRRLQERFARPHARRGRGYLRVRQLIRRRVEAPELEHGLAEVRRVAGAGTAAIEPTGWPWGRVRWRRPAGRQRGWRRQHVDSVRRRCDAGRALLEPTGLRVELPRRHALLRVRVEKAPKGPLASVGDFDLGRERELCAAHGGADGVEGATGHPAQERVPTEESHEERDPERPHVERLAVVDDDAVVVEGLRRQKRDRSFANGARRTRVDNARGTEVGDERVTFFVEEDVRGLDVEVHDVALVHVQQALEHLPEHAARGVLREAARDNRELVAHAQERAFHEGQDEQDLPVLGVVDDLDEPQQPFVGEALHHRHLAEDRLGHTAHDRRVLLLGERGLPCRPRPPHHVTARRCRTAWNGGGRHTCGGRVGRRLRREVQLRHRRTTSNARGLRRAGRRGLRGGRRAGVVRAFEPVAPVDDFDCDASAGHHVHRFIHAAEGTLADVRLHQDVVVDLVEPSGVELVHLDVALVDAMFLAEVNAAHALVDFIAHVAEIARDADVSRARQPSAHRLGVLGGIDVHR